MNTHTVCCYDRFAPLKRWALASLLLLGTAAALLLSLPADAAPGIQQLPRVVVAGKSLATQAADARASRVVTLPRVVIVAERQGALRRVALASPGGPAF